MNLREVRINNAKAFISRLIVSKSLWQLLLALFMIGMAAFFIRNEHLELAQIKAQLLLSRPGYVALGVLLTLVYILFQAQMYMHCFKSLKHPIPFAAAVTLFLKRNLVSVFLPAGGFSSLVFFNREIEEKGASRSQIHLASTLFGFFGILSVILVALPVLGWVMLYHDLQQAEIFGFIFLFGLTGMLAFSIYSISRKGTIYRLITRLRPSLSILLDEMVSHELVKKHLLITLLYSLGIELTGMAHLYIAMRALGLEASWTAAMVGYIIMVVLLIASPFLRGLGAIEVSLTYLLGQYGYPILTAATITLLFRFFEFWLPLLAGIFSFFTKRDNLLLRVLPAFIILVLGVVNLVSALTPALPARLALVSDLLPPGVILFSNSMVVVFGLILTLLSVFLLKGSKRAWYLGLFLTGFSALGHLVKGVDYEEALLALLAVGALVATKGFYRLKPHPKFTRISYRVFIYSILVVLLYGIAGFYFIEKRHFGTDFELGAAVKAVFQTFFLVENPSLLPQTPFARDFLWSIYLAGAGMILFITYGLLMPYFTRPYNTGEDFNQATDLVNRYGKSALDYYKTYPDKLLYFSDDRTAFLSFKVTRHFALVLEDPVCRDATTFLNLVAGFDRFCAENGFINAYYRVPEQSLKHYTTLKKKYLPVGEEAIVDLRTFTLEGKKIRTTRSAINRLASEGLEVKVYPPPVKEGLLQKLEQVSDDWLKGLNRKEVAFTQGVFDRSTLREQTLVTVENQEEKVFAFLNLIPSYAPGDVSYDLIRKVTDAPNGVLDMLLARTFLYLKDEGFTTVNMGLAPLSGMEGITITEKTIRYAYDNLKTFHHFKGLRKYKEKFFPKWEKKYLVYSHNYHLLQVPQALKRVSEGS